MINVFKSLLEAFAIFVVMANFWQGMHEIYKFDRCDNASAVFSFSISFFIIFISMLIRKIKR